MWQSNRFFQRVADLYNDEKSGIVEITTLQMGGEAQRIQGIALSETQRETIHRRIVEKNEGR